MNPPLAVLVSLRVLCFSIVSSTLISAFGWASAQSDDSGININLIPTSQARFIDCMVTEGNGTSSFSGLSPDDSIQSVLTDRNLNTILMGGAIFDISSSKNSSIVNGPGEDLMVVEMAAAEAINASISDPQTGENKSLTVSPTRTSNKNDCLSIMNQAFLDLSSFQVPEGSSVASIRLDNLGTPDTVYGSDIAEIFILEHGNVSSTDNSTDISSETMTRNSSSMLMGGLWLPAPR